MLNRHFLRAKTLCALYAYRCNPSDDITVKTKNLLYSFDKLFDIEFYLFAALFEVRRLALIRIEDNKRKLLPSEEDLNPNMRFVNNTFLTKLENDEVLSGQIAVRKISFSEDEEHLLRNILLRFQSTPTYKEYMLKESVSEEDERRAVVRLFKNHIICDEALYDYLCEGYLELENDYDTIAQGALFCLKEYDGAWDSKESAYDKEFVEVLFTNTIKDSQKTDQIIGGKIQNWDMERIAIMDIIIIKMGISELLYCPKIPVNVTLNEYVELANEYSTPKSRLFVNGLLDRIMVDLRADGKIKKDTNNEEE